LIETPGVKELPQRLFLLPDGKFLVGSNIYPEDSIHLMRFLSDGSPDPSFGVGGVLTQRFEGRETQGVDYDIDDDGNILASGYYIFETELIAEQRAFVARFHADGTPDAAFGNGGFVTGHAGGGVTKGVSLALAADGKMYAVVKRFTPFDDVLVGLLPDGTLNPDFGTAGLVPVVFPEFASFFMTDLDVQNDGAIVTMGRAATAVPGDTFFDYLVERFLPDGSVDGTFGVDGISVISATDHDAPVMIAVLPDGKILMNGWESDIALIRLLGGGVGTGTGSGTGTETPGDDAGGGCSLLP
jgi:uncharacterized delta-60 repeat protein